MLKFCVRERIYDPLNATKFRKNLSRDSAHGLPVFHCFGGDTL